MHARVRQLLVSCSIVLGVLVLAGATYQGVATALERRKYPHPGQLVDVGGHQLHIHCLGEGSPTVVLEAPAAGLSAAWGWVQPALATRTRACAYDRAGLGWSEAGDRPYDPGRVPEELRALLDAAKEDGPFVLVGHSLGASFVRTFAGLYPLDAAGLVMIDPPGDVPRDARVFTMSPWLARAGVLRATGLLSESWTGLPASSAGAMSAFFNRPDHLTRASRELARWDDAVRLGAGARVPAGLPVSSVHASLNDEASARAATAAILEVVARVR
ncbi:MAG: alpha/beta fold hydrolase [Vicinamibacterales bacterium]